MDCDIRSLSLSDDRSSGAVLAPLARWVQWITFLWLAVGLWVLLSASYPSGELVVQTANAAFSLIYLGATDSDGQVGIPTSVQGWWLMEV